MSNNKTQVPSAEALRLVAGWTDTERNAVLEFVSRLEAELVALRKDSLRIDALERFAKDATAYNGSFQTFAELRFADPDDNTSDKYYDPDDNLDEEWNVIGPQTSWGCRHGRGGSFRDAIDNAMAWEYAQNLDDLTENVPII